MASKAQVGGMMDVRRRFETVRLKRTRTLVFVNTTKRRNANYLSRCVERLSYAAQEVTILDGQPM
jgi:hypothetical protein